MKIYTEINLWDFEAWGGAETTLDKIIDEDKCELFEQVLEELYPDGMDETDLNDLLRFDSDWCFEACGIRTREEIEEELEEVLEEMRDVMAEYRVIVEEDDGELFEEEGDADEYWRIHYAAQYERLEVRAEELRDELDNY